MSANSPADAESLSEVRALAQAERSGRPFLVFRDRNNRQQLFFLESGTAAASVGRSSSSDLVLDWDDQVSRTHARFEFLDGAWMLVDDGLSSNGSFVHEERVSGARRMNDGDTLRFGRTIVTFRAPHRAPAATPGAPEPPQRRPSAPPGAAEKPAAVALSTTQRRVLGALCRPYKDRGGFASPASDEEIAEQLVLSVGEVRAHLRVLCAKFGVEDPSHAPTRVRLVERAFTDGLISERDL